MLRKFCMKINTKQYKRKNVQEQKTKENYKKEIQKRDTKEEMTYGALCETNGTTDKF